MIIAINVSEAWESDALLLEDTPYSGVIYVTEPINDELADPKCNKINSLDLVLIDALFFRRKHLIGATLYWDGHAWTIDAVGRRANVRELWISRPKVAIE